MDLSPRPCSICGDLRPVSRRSAPVVTCQPCRRGTVREKPSGPPHAKTMTCASCNKSMWRSHSSLPAGRARCLTCRRAAHGLQPHERVNDAKAAARRAPSDCQHCKAPVPTGSRRWKYCSDGCFRRARNARGSGKPSASARGYGYAHQKLRRELLPLAYGTDCHLCGEVMNEGDRLHLDHTEDRSGYRGIVHDVCNVLEGARRGGQRARQARLERGWRPGQDPSTRRRPQVRTTAQSGSPQAA